MNRARVAESRTDEFAWAGQVRGRARPWTDSPPTELGSAQSKYLQLIPTKHSIKHTLTLMDSLGRLGQTLPSDTTEKQLQEAFRSAALSLTGLFKVGKKAQTQGKLIRKPRDSVRASRSRLVA